MGELLQRDKINTKIMVNENCSVLTSTTFKFFFFSNEIYKKPSLPIKTFFFVFYFEYFQRKNII